MSSKKDKHKQKSGRVYVLNVAKQFLQGIEFNYNPLTNVEYFSKICGCAGIDTHSFYLRQRKDAEKFLTKFKGPALEQIICSCVPGSSLILTIPENEPRRTPMSEMGARASSLLAADGITILRNIAAVTLVAAAFDLCYSRHHQGGLSPI